MQGTNSLDQLQTDKHGDTVASDLIEQMLDVKPHKRPSAESVLKHPFFWSSEEELQFSQRQNRGGTTGRASVGQLEGGGRAVVKGDWMEHITVPLQEDLVEFRPDNGGSVRDLLLAMRNTSDRDWELSPEVQETLGSIPPCFTSASLTSCLHLPGHAELYA